MGQILLPVIAAIALLLFVVGPVNTQAVDTSTLTPSTNLPSVTLPTIATSTYKNANSSNRNGGSGGGFFHRVQKITTAYLQISE